MENPNPANPVHPVSAEEILLDRIEVAQSRLEVTQSQIKAALAEINAALARIRVEQGLFNDLIPKLGEAGASQPFCFRIPSNGEKDRFFGCVQTFWAERIRGDNPDVESWLVRCSDEKRGTRFICYASAVAYMERQRQRSREAQVSPSSELEVAA